MDITAVPAPTVMEDTYVLALELTLAWLSTAEEIEVTVSEFFNPYKVNAVGTTAVLPE